MIDAFMEILTRFKFDWSSLRSVMIGTGAVISGSVVVSVLVGGGFVPRDLDFYVDSKGFGVMLMFLMDHGYRVVTSESRPYHLLEMEYPRSTIILTLRYGGEGEKIDLIGTTDEHVLSVITRFHSTVAMNYIASYGIVCLYPEWTMRRSGLVSCGDGSREIVEKYRSRGFQMSYCSAELARYDDDHECGKDICCPRIKRDLYDKFNLLISFEDGGMTYICDVEKRRFNWMLKDVIECKKELG